MSCTNMSSLKIIIVAGPNDEDYVKRNISLIEALNPSANFSIDVIDNGFMIEPLSGISSNINARLLLGYRPFNNYPKNSKASYQHASALNSYFAKYKNIDNFNLILDPDFYITRKNWIADILKFMQDGKLSIYGSSWAPCWYNKYRDFPSVHCMFINTELLDPLDLDFLPNLNIRQQISINNQTKAPIKKKPKPAIVKNFIKNTKRLIYKLARFYKVMTINRSLIGSSKDTGYRIYKKYYNKTKHSILVSNIRESDNFNLPHLKYRLGREFEELLPIMKSYLPRQGTYIRSKSSLYVNIARQDLLDIGFEEFVFSNSHFAFHIRRFNKTNRSKEAELEIIDRIISKLL